MISKEIQHLLDKAGDSHAAAKVLIDKGFVGFSAAQSYYTMYYLVEAVLLSKGLRFSSHSALIASYGKEFAKTGLQDPKYHRYVIVAQKRRETGHYAAELLSLTNRPWNPINGRKNSSKPWKRT